MTINVRPHGRWRPRMGQLYRKDQAVPYIVNFSMVDGDGDGKITADEFKAGCAKGMVKSTQP
jgi:hypothetical protein